MTGLFTKGSLTVTSGQNVHSIERAPIGKMVSTRKCYYRTHRVDSKICRAVLLLFLVIVSSAVVRALAYIAEPTMRGWPPPESETATKTSFSLTRVQAFPAIAKASAGASLELETRRGNATPQALTAGDFDEDGVPDLVASYSDSRGGILSLHRGNIDSLYPNSKEAKERRRLGEFTDSAFLSRNESFAVPEQADFLGTGDFNNDSHLDVVSAARGGDRLYFMLGDGRGGFSQTRSIALPGLVTALATGEINRPDGITDLVVGINGRDGPDVLVFESPNGVLYAIPEHYSVSFPVSSLLLGKLSLSPMIDLAIASGNELIIVQGRDRKLSFDESRQAQAKPAALEGRSFASSIESLAVGDFSGRHQPELVLSFDNGSVEMLSPPDAKPCCRSSEGISQDEHQWPINNWNSREVFRASSEDRRSKAVLVATRSSILRADGLVVGGGTKINILNWAERKAPSGNQEALGSVNRELSSIVNSLEVGDQVADILPVKLNGDALSDLVILHSGDQGLGVSLSEPESTFTVTNTNDSGPGSLRQAILSANVNPGLDSITFNIPGSGVRTIS